MKMVICLFGRQLDRQHGKRSTLQPDLFLAQVKHGRRSRVVIKDKRLNLLIPLVEIDDEAALSRDQAQ